MANQLDDAIRQAKVKMRNTVLQAHSNLINCTIEKNTSKIIGISVK